MSRIARSAAWLTAVALLAMPTRAALADTPFFQWTGCGGTVFNTCVDVTISKGTYTLVDASQELIKMEVKNLGSLGSSSYGSVFTAFGVKNMPYRLTALRTVVGAGTGWSFTTGISELKNFGEGFQGVNINGNTGTPVGGTTTFYFTFLEVDYVTHTCTSKGGKSKCITTYPGAPTGWAAGRPMEFALHGQAGPNDCSTKLNVNSIDGGVYSPTVVTTPMGTIAGCEGPPSVVPEPATFVLSATGLVALLGVARRRKWLA